MEHGHRCLIGVLGTVALAAALALIAPGAQGALAAGTIYVDTDATGANNGTSWANAYTDLQPALTAAGAGDQIWVAEGTYKPTSGSDRYASFQMKNGVALYGGFDPSVGDTGWEDRDWEANLTILSGDIGTAGVASDNSYHVFYHPSGKNLDSTAILDGFTVTGGNASSPGWPHFAGGGMFNDGSSPALSNCTFSGNLAYQYGGGLYNYGSSSSLLTNCTFQDNSADIGGGMYTYGSPTLTDCTFSGNSASYGGGMCNYYGSPTLTGCTFSGNSALVYGDGGAMYNIDASPALTGCTFAGNWADRDGAGMFNDSSSPTLTNCIFSGNSAVSNAGGMFNRNSSSPTLINCTFSGNSAGSYAGAMYNQSSSPSLTNCTFSGNSAVYNGGGILNTSSSSPVLTNCILWGDTPGEIFNWDPTSSPVVTHSDIQGTYPGEGNIDADPRFVDPANDDVHLGTCSRCVDRGNNSAPDLPAFDFEGDNRILDGDGDGTATVDMGVDEATVAASCGYHLYLPVVLKAR